MKKLTAISLIGCLIVFQVQAQTDSASVSKIPEKDSQFENTVTIDEFNSLVKTLRGVYNFLTETGLQIGINEEDPASTLTLDIGGKVGAEEYCDANGEHCIDPTTWDARPQLELQPPAATCKIRYRIKDAKYESDWQETGVNNDPIGKIALLHSGLEANCSGSGCGVQMSLQCSPNLAVAETASCRLRYRVNHLKQPALTPWVTTEVTKGTDWVEGTWSNVIAPNGAWGDGLNIQAGLDCTDQALRCQLGYKLHNEVESPDWKLSALTQGAGWKDAETNLLSADVGRACDQRLGCGLQMQSRCVGTTSTLKTALYKCPSKKETNCPSLCNGQISTEDKCSYQQLGAANTCTILLTERCEAIGHLVQ